MRSINERFIEDLKIGCLSYFLNQVKSNRDKLCLEIRDGYINIYYKGGNLLKITQKRSGYSFHFDANYCLNKEDDSNYIKLKSLNSNSVQDYIDNFALMMKEMDSWFADEKHQKCERDFQHKLLADNRNVIDIEYAPPKAKDTGKKLNVRLDMLLVDADKLIIVENKYGTGAVTGNAGIRKHYKDICNLLNTDELYDELLQSVESIAKAKYELGLIDTPLKSIDKRKTEVLFLLADFNEKSQTLKNELEEIKRNYPADKLYPISILMMNSNESIIDLSKIVKA